MPWTCRIVAPRDIACEIGEMYFSESHNENFTTEFRRTLSPEYKRDWFGKRAPLFVETPAGTWCVDAVSTDGHGNNNNHGWTVTGEAPTITAHPSINIPGVYHGWLTDGILSDDIEGRTYP